MSDDLDDLDEPLQRGAAVWGLRKRVKLGDVDDATARWLLEKYGRLVHHVVRQYPLPDSCQAIDREDLLAIGQCALIGAWVGFDADQAEFTTWSVIQIRQSLADAVRRAYGQTVSERKAVLRVAAHRRWIEGGQRGKEPPAPDDEQRVLARQHQERVVIALDKTASTRSHGVEAKRTTADLLYGFAPEAFEQTTSEERIDEDRRQAWLERKLANGVLTERERTVLHSRLEQRTLSEIGDDLGISRERVRQLETQAIAKLRAAAGADGLV